MRRRSFASTAFGLSLLGRTYGAKKTGGYDALQSVGVVRLVWCYEGWDLWGSLPIDNVQHPEQFACPEVRSHADHVGPNDATSFYFLNEKLPPVCRVGSAARVAALLHKIR